MKSYSYLTYFVNPYRAEQIPRLFVRSSESLFGEISYRELSDIKSPVVSYQLDELFSLLPRDENISFSEVIDVCNCYRLLHGKPFRGRRGYEPWTIWSLLKAQFQDVPEVQKLCRFTYSINDANEGGTVVSSMRQMSLLIEKLWSKLIQKLAQNNERERFFSVEKPLNEILLRQQFLGIRISQAVLLQKLDKLDKDIGAADRDLRRRWKIRNLQSKEQIIESLRTAGFECLHKHQKDSLFDNIIEIYGVYHELPRLLKTYQDCKRDKAILLRLGAIGSERIYPIYKTFATVTGRIIVAYPSLQYLKKENRNIMIPDEGKQFLYPDYSQFEPGIMADDSKDKNLINDFNSGDLYCALSSKLFGNEENRSSAKILFLAFCFGMSLGRMVSIVSESISKPKRFVEKALNGFFGRYSGLADWRKELEQELISKSRIGTRCGNFRYRNSEKEFLAAEEKRWVVSQRIQGTAALIFKKAIIEISNTLDEVDILLPMHDALLLQVPIDYSQELQGNIEQIFKDKFSELCPSIKPRITFNSFW